MNYIPLKRDIRALLAKHHVRHILRAVCDAVHPADTETRDVIKTALAMLPMASDFCGVAFRMGSREDALAIAHAAWDEGDDAEDADDQVRAKAAWAIDRESTRLNSSH